MLLGVFGAKESIFGFQIDVNQIYKKIYYKNPPKIQENGFKSKVCLDIEKIRALLFIQLLKFQI